MLESERKAGSVSAQLAGLPSLNGNLLHEHKALFEQVRTALILQRTGEVVEELSRPENKELFRRAMLKLSRAMIADIADMESTSHEELEEMRAELEPQFAAAIEQKLEDPDQIRQMAMQTATNENRLQHEFLALMKAQFEALPQSESAASKTFFEEISLAIKPLGPSFETRQKFLERLTDVAREQGVETAVSRRKLEEITREFFPTSLDYRQNFESQMKISKVVLQRIMAACTRDDDRSGKIAATVLSHTLELMDTCAEIGREALERRIAEIYG